MANVPISAFNVPANTVGIGATGYSLTGSASASFMDLAGTWNTSGTPTAIKLNITDTASNAASLLMDLQVGGASRVRFDKTGAIVNTLNTYGTSNFTLRGGASQNFGINLQSITAYFQTNSAVGVGITVSGSAGSVGVSNNGSFGFHTTIPGADGLDVILTRRGAANLRLGALDAAAPVAQTLSVQSVVAGTTNTIGQEFRIDGSQGTGTGAGGSLVFRVAPAGLTGFAQNALATALTIGSNGQIVIPGTGSSSLIGLHITNVAFAGWNAGGFNAIASNRDGVIGWSSVTSAAQDQVIDVRLYRDAANTLALRNGTAAQTFRVYNTTDGTNSEWLAMLWGSNEARLFVQNTGTGANNRNLLISTDGGTVAFGTSNTARWRINSSAAFVAEIDNTYDIGASGANRPRYIRAASALVSPSTTVASLPAAATAGSGARSLVTDANATTFQSIVAAGGANVVPVYSDGTNWRIG